MTNRQGTLPSFTLEKRVFNLFADVLFQGTTDGYMGSLNTYGAVAATTITSTGATVINGNLALSPGTSVTGFPPGVVTGRSDIANTAAAAAHAQTSAAYTALAAVSTSTIPTILDGYTYTPGAYTSAGGTFTLAQSGAGTLTLNGAGTYIFKTATTLTTGAGGTPTMTLTGGATADKVYFVVGSSATLNSGSAGTFNGSVIAATSITDTSGGTVNGTLAARDGAVTLSAATTINPQAPAVTPAFVASPTPANAFGSTNAQANITHKGVVSVTRNSAGVYTFVFGAVQNSITVLDTYVRVLECNVRWDNQGDGYVPAQGLSMYISGNHVADHTLCSLQVTFVNALGVATDPDDLGHSTVGHFQFVFTDSTAP